MRAISISLLLPVLSTIGVFAAPLEPFSTEVRLENIPTLIPAHSDDPSGDGPPLGQPDVSLPIDHSKSNPAGSSISSKIMKYKTKTVTQSCSATDDADYSTFIMKSLKSTRSLHKPHHKSKTKHSLTEKLITPSPSPSSSNSSLTEVLVEETEVVTYMVTDSSSSFPTITSPAQTASTSLAARDELDRNTNSVLAGDGDGDSVDDDDDVKSTKSTKSKKHKESTQSKKHHHHTKSSHTTSATEDSPEETASTATGSPQVIITSTSYTTISKDATKQEISYEEKPKQSCQPSTVSVYPSTQWVTLPPSTPLTASSEEYKDQESEHVASTQGSISISYRTVKTIQPTDDGAAAHLAVRETAAPEMSSKSMSETKSKTHQSTKTTRPDEDDQESSSQPRNPTVLQTKITHSAEPEETESQDPEKLRILKSYTRIIATRSRDQPKQETTEMEYPNSGRWAQPTTDEASELGNPSKSKTGKVSKSHSSKTSKQTELEDPESESFSQSKTGKASKTYQSSKTMSASSLEHSSTKMSISYRTIHPSGTKVSPVAKQTKEPDVEDDPVGTKTKSGASDSSKTDSVASGTKTRSRTTTNETEGPDDGAKQF